MDPLTPSKKRGRPVLGDDHTDISSPPAPWDGREDEEDEPRQTAPTQVIVPGDYDLAPGTRLGEYQIEAKLGQGGMGVVFAAVHPLIGKRAAIKILNKELCADPHMVERFIDEARVVNQIGHPNIVDVFAFGEMPDGRRYFVMEWLKGETLRDRIARGPMAIDEACRVVRQLARALQAAHEKGVIHRDLKPDNVYLVEVRDEASKVKLLDFGIAKLASNDHRVEKTATGAIIGTPQYIAPEQAKGYAIDHRADIYALGGIVFELFTGRPPFVADNAMEMVAKHLMETPVRVSTLVPDVQPEIDELVAQMLAKQPDGRPTLARVVEVLESSRDRASIQTRPPLATPVPVAAATERSAPFVRPATETPMPSADQSGPVARPTFDGDRSVPVSQPAFDVVPEPRRSRPPWVAIAGLPIAGLIAFLLVRALGSSGEDTPPTAAPVAVDHAPVAVDHEPAPATDVTAPVVAAKDPELVTPGEPAAAKQEPPAVAKKDPAVVAKKDPPAMAKKDPAAVAKKDPPAVAKKDPPAVAKKDPRVAAADPLKKKEPAKARLQLEIIGGGPNTRVRIDGSPASTDAMLTLGPHTIEIHSRGMIPQRFTLEVGKSGAVKTVALQPEGGELMDPGSSPRPRRRRSP